MGNVLSTKYQNNKDIWHQSARNTQYACLFGLIFTLWKFRRQIFNLFHQRQKIHQNEPMPAKYEPRPPDPSLSMEMLSYFIKFPLFIASFSLFFKKLIRMNYISSNLQINVSSLPIQKYSISFMSFLLAYFIQQNASIFHWKWALLLLIRALYSLIRMNLNINIQDGNNNNISNILKVITNSISIEHVNAFTFCLQCILAQQYSSYMPSGLISTYNSVNPTNYSQPKYISVYQHHHKQLPSCCSTASFHQCEDTDSCIDALWKDAIYIKMTPSFKFFLKLHTIASMLNIKQFFKLIRNDPMSLSKKIMINAIRSCCYWFIGTHIGIRYCSCFSKKILSVFHGIFSKLMNLRNNGFEYVSDRNLWINILGTAIIGRYTILFETVGRRTEMTLVLIWYSLVQMIRMQCGLETYDRDKYHWLLNSKGFVSLMLASCVAINMYVYCNDMKYLKTVERALIHNFLIN